VLISIKKYSLAYLSVVRNNGSAKVDLVKHHYH